MARDRLAGDQDTLHTGLPQHHSVLERVARRPNKPSAYSYYQKLAQDFQALDDELWGATAEHEDLQNKVNHLRAREQEVAQVQVAAQQKQWAREREVQIETIVQKSVEVEALHLKVDELEALELCLEAEIQVLQERQQEEAQNEASRIDALVHGRTHLFEAELAKGKMDLDFIAQVVNRTHLKEAREEQNHEEHESAKEKASLHALAEEVQQRRRLEFERAAENLNARLLSFEHEKEEIRRKANDIRARKQRALQILTTNQQQAIKTFFTSTAGDTGTSNALTPALLAESSEEAEFPQLNFNSILDGLNQSGLQVGQIQSARSEQVSARKSVQDALREAQVNVEDGEKRVEELAKVISDRRRSANAVLSTVSTSESTLYDGRMGIESYAPLQYDLVYFVRALVFSWIDAATVQSESKPATQLLEKEVQRWEITRGVVEQESSRRARSALAHSLLATILSEVVSEVARDIHREFQSNCTRVRDAISSGLRDVFFQSSVTRNTNIENTKMPTTTQVKTATAPVLSAALFNCAFEQLKTTRQRRSVAESNDAHESVQPLHLATQYVKETDSAAQSSAIAAALPMSAVSASPKKARFAFFSSSKPNKNTPSVHVKQPVPRQLMHNHFVLNKNKVTVVQLTAHSIGDQLPSTATEKKMWQRMIVEVSHIEIPSNFSHPSSVEVSADARVCVIGTTSGEVLLWDLRRQPPLLLRSYAAPSKVSRASITRISLSTNETRILTLNHLKSIHVLSTQSHSATAPAATATAATVSRGGGGHSSDCFVADDPRKWKPLPLALVMELTSDSLAQPALSEDVRKMLPCEESIIRLPQFVSTSFHSSLTLLGEQTSVVCGISDGDIVKINMRGTHPSDIAARFDAPLPNDIGNKDLRTRDIQREFFCGHKHPVLFVLSHSVRNRQKLLSIDSEANFIDWEYDSDHFSGFGWFSPAQQYHLNLHTSDNGDSSAETQGTIIQIASTSDKKRVVLMVFFAASSAAAKKKGASSNSGAVHFYQVLTDSIQVLPVLIQLNLLSVSSAPPRFALTTTMPATKKSTGSGSSDHFLFVLMNNTVQILSLSSGESCCAPIQLQQASKSSLMFNSISVSSHCMRQQRARCSMVVTGDHHNKVLVYRFKQQEQP